MQLLGERLRAGEAAAEHLQAAVQLCQRSSPPLSPAEREALWFPLLELLLGPPHDGEARCSSLSRVLALGSCGSGCAISGAPLDWRQQILPS